MTTEAEQDQLREKRRLYQREYKQREGVKERNKAWRERDDVKAHRREYNRKRRAERSAFFKQLLSQFSCLLCGNPDPSVIHWHHVVPEDKSFCITANPCQNLDKWWDEFLKCIPLCANCHCKIHKEEMCLIPLTNLTV